MLLERGDVWSVISDIIQNKEIDLVVAGTHGRQGLKKLVLGSEAERIYRRAALSRSDSRPPGPTTKRH